MPKPADRRCRGPVHTGESRAQRGWTKKVHRMHLPGLKWQLGSVLGAGRPATEVLDELRTLWIGYGNPGALRDALRVCGKLTDSTGCGSRLASDRSR